MVSLLRTDFALLVFTNLRHAKSGVPDGEKPFPGAEGALRQLLEHPQLPRGQVQELLPTKPESHARNTTYLTESSLKQPGSLIYCEDWCFTLQRITEGCQ